MALKKDITDIKGVKVRYHKLASFELKDGALVVKVRGYVNQATRDSERDARTGNELYFAYNQETEAMQADLDEKSAALASMPDDESPERAALKAEVVELTDKYNDRITNGTRPEWQNPVDRYYNETEVQLPFIEPLTFESMYKLLAAEDAYLGAESI